MHVCVLTYSFYESDTRVLQYVRALVERGDTVDVIALRKAGAPVAEVLDGINVYRIQSRKVNEQNRLTYLARIVRFVLVSACVLGSRHFSKPYSVVHVHSVPDFLVFAAALPKLLGAGVVLDIHDILPEFYASKFGLSAESRLFKMLVLVEKLSIRFADHVIIANDLWRERLLTRSATAEKCTAITNYPDPEVFYPGRRRRTDERFVIVYPGTLNHHQGLDIAIRAIALVTAEIQGVEFHIYGDGPAKESLIGLTRDLQLSERVSFHETLPTNQIADVMADSDLAVVPKRASSAFGNEAASTKIMEFMALGVPVIVSRTKIDSYLYDASTVMFFESESVPDLTRCIRLLKKNLETREELVENGLRYVSENKWLERKREYLNLMDCLTAQAPLGGAKDRPDLPAGSPREPNSVSPKFRFDRTLSLRLVNPVSRLLQNKNQIRIPILMYHGIREGTGNRHPYFETNTSPELFARQMTFLRDHGYDVVSLKDAIGAMTAGENGKRRVVITFDDGYQDFYTHAFPVLERFGFKATIFVISGLTADESGQSRTKNFMTWQQVREVRTHGFEVGSHTVTHPELHSIGFEEVQREVRDSKKTIEDKLGGAVLSFSYPFAFPEHDRLFVREVKAVLAASGYAQGVSTMIGTAGREHEMFFLPRLPVNTFDDLRLFRAKLEGAYDWLHTPQSMYKALKQICGQPGGSAAISQ
jgi:glycosyltransferase involved in cell wall biosynthesis/peptidoglycan/xylan/chitin deacetylase (PgdA/CDA1 family)